MIATLQVASVLTSGVGCGDTVGDGSGPGFASAGPTTLGPTSSGETGESGDASAGDSSDTHGPGDGPGDGPDDAGDPVKFDTPDGDPPDFAEVPCGVDILFVVDNSGSMSQHKDDIVDAFDLFVAEMVDNLAPATPVHVGLTRATGFFDPGNGSGWDFPSCEFTYLDGTWYPPTQGNNGNNGQQGRLFEAEGLRYFEFEIGDDPAGVAGWFQTAMTEAIMLDGASNSESVVAAAAYPFAPINSDYNAGFLRDKAVLVLFLLSDAPDASPAEIPTEAFVELVSAAKAGCGDGCVVPTGIVQSMCYGELGNTNTRVFDFMHGFGAPPPAIEFFTGNQGPESFTSALGATLAETIAFTCEHVVPVE